ncbi:hypothetical protein ACHAWF_002923, partial [Thalassiosira exigua]
AKHLKHTVRLAGIPVEGTSYIYGDNQPVLANTTMPNLQLKKNSNSVAFHFVQEGCACDEWRTDARQGGWPHDKAAAWW